MESINQIQLVQWMKEKISAVTGLASVQIEENIPLTRYGLDSSAMLTLACDLEDYLGIELEPESLYEHPTIHAIVEVLMKKISQ